MFTGIVQEIGVFKKRIRADSKYQLSIGASNVLKGVKKGDSIAVNGVCLTVIDFTDKSFVTDLMPESLKASNLGDLKIGSLLNLEQAVRVNDFLGGHIITGHVDGTGVVKNIRMERNVHLLKIQVGEELRKYLMDKGSVAVNGVSLTIMEVRENSFIISLIPETWNNTNFRYAKVGDRLNIETDLIGKYVYKFLKDYEKKEDKLHFTNIDKEFLINNNFL